MISILVCNLCINNHCLFICLFLDQEQVFNAEYREIVYHMISIFVNGFHNITVLIVKIVNYMVYKHLK